MRTAERTADLVGQSFGSATVIGRVDGKIGSRTWLAVCICGREFTRTTSHLREDAKRGRECKTCTTPAQRFARLVSTTPDANGCLNWIGATNGSAGYGIFHGSDDLNSLGYRKLVLAHRYAYEHPPSGVFKIPAGLVVDHLCRNRLCVNRDHMELVTDRVNILRGTSPSAKQARQTHCKRGHEFSESNTRINGRKRCCRICAAMRARAAAGSGHEPPRCDVFLANERATKEQG